MPSRSAPRHPTLPRSMEKCTKLIEVLSKLHWVVLYPLVFILIRPLFALVVDRIKSGNIGKIIVKIGGQELSIEEANQQQVEAYKDLQNQIIEIKNAQAIGSKISPLVAIKPRNILWVDENPKNNSFFAEQLIDSGVFVDYAISTGEGMEKLFRNGYDAVISNMVRSENGELVADAGIKLYERMKCNAIDVPFIIFCGRKNVEKWRETVSRIGIRGIASSITDVYKLLGLKQIEIEQGTGEEL